MSSSSSCSAIPNTDSNCFKPYVIFPEAGEYFGKDHLDISIQVTFGKIIWYTLDGTIPVIGNNNTLRYSRPIRLDGTFSGCYTIHILVQDVRDFSTELFKAEYCFYTSSSSSSESQSSESSSSQSESSLSSSSISSASSISSQSSLSSSSETCWSSSSLSSGSSLSSSSSA
jgi:hypothetical protein